MSARWHQQLVSVHCCPPNQDLSLDQPTVVGYFSWWLYTDQISYTSCTIQFKSILNIKIIRAKTLKRHESTICSHHCSSGPDCWTYSYLFLLDLQYILFLPYHHTLNIWRTIFAWKKKHKQLRLKVSIAVKFKSYFWVSGLHLLDSYKLGLLHSWLCTEFLTFVHLGIP